MTKAKPQDTVRTGKLLAGFAGTLSGTCVRTSFHRWKCTEQIRAKLTSPYYFCTGINAMQSGKVNFATTADNVGWIRLERKGV
jgi:hypothetical protein